MNERLGRRDWIFLGVCAAITAISVLLAVRYFARAFPEATIDFRYDRVASKRIAERLLASERLEPRGMKHTAVFDADDQAKVFLERSLGLEAANKVMGTQVHVWFWHHRWFRPLQEEEFAVDVAPNGEVVAFARTIPEDRALPPTPLDSARARAEAFLRTAGVDASDLRLVSQSERNLPKRVQRIFTWESKSIHPAGAPYRHVVHVDGNAVTAYTQRLRVPDDWQRAYRDLRSKNLLAGNIDAVFLGITIVAALAVFVVRLRRGDISRGFLLAVGGVGAVLVAGVSLNTFPLAEAEYETTTSYAAFLAKIIFGSIISALGTAILLMIVCGAGEVLYRERLPSQLAIPRLWTAQALASKRVFKSFVLAYTLVAFFFAYQVVFYIVAARFGAWAPADIPYDDMLNTALPWFAVLFAGFFPSFSEEFLSRAFSIPFFQRIVRSRFAAIVVAGFIWGFGHATYPNQPFYIRGLEVGFAGVLLGYLMDAFGLLPLLIWHFTVDAFYTSLLLFRSQNTYYIASAAVASFLFVIPMLLQIVLYIRNRGFIRDDDLTNATMPLAPPAEVKEREAPPPLPEPIRPSRRAIAVAVVAVIAAGGTFFVRPPAISHAVDYATGRAKAKEIAVDHVRRVMRQAPPPRVIATPAEGFRSWDRESRREDGGAPAGFDSVAAEYVVRHSSVRALTETLRSRVQGGTWSVRLFAPVQKEEFFVEIDPRTARVVGYHRYQDERRPDAALERGTALDIAWRAFATYGIDRGRFELREALAFQQPARRDWLFHFDEREPIAARAHRRITVRVAGDDITQFTTTVRIPEAVYREETTETLVSVTLTLVKIGGILALLTFVVTGFVIAAFRHRVHWRRAAAWAAALSIIPIVSELASLETEFFYYGTSIQWETFLTGLVVGSLRDIGVRVGLLFLAIAGLDAVHPHALSLVSREGRRRFGASAAIAALTATAFLIVTDSGLDWLAALVPEAASIDSLPIADSVAIPFPAVAAIGDAIYLAVIVSAAVALFLEGGRRLVGTWSGRDVRSPLLVVGVLFAVMIDSSASPREIPLMLAGAALTAVVIWLIGRFVLGRNALAWPLAVFFSSGLESAMEMLRQSRPDLQWNGAVAMVAVLLAVVTFATSRANVSHEESPA